MAKNNLLAVSVILLTLTSCATSKTEQVNLSSEPVNTDQRLEQRPLAQQPEKLPAVDPKADLILKKMGDLLSSAHAFTFQAITLKEQVLPSGQKLQYDATVEIKMKRSNALFANVTSGAKRKRFWYNGNTITLLDLNNNFYATEQAPDKIDDTLDYIMDRYEVSMPLTDFVFADPYAVMTEMINSGFYVAEVEVNGIKTHHLAFRQDNVDWQIWIDAEGRPVPRKFVITYKNTTSSPQFIAFFKDWNFGPRFRPNEFNFQPPENAEEIEFLTEENP